MNEEVCDCCWRTQNHFECSNQKFQKSSFFDFESSYESGYGFARTINNMKNAARLKIWIVLLLWGHLSSFWPNKFYFDNIATLATICCILSDKVKNTTIFRFFQISKAYRICWWSAMTKKLHKSMRFDSIWISKINSTIFDVVKMACKTITRFVTRFKVEKWRFLKFLIATFKMMLCRSEALQRLCIRFVSKLGSFVITSFDLRCIEIFFAIFWQFEKRPKSAIKIR